MLSRATLLLSAFHWSFPLRRALDLMFWRVSEISRCIAVILNHFPFECILPFGVYDASNAKLSLRPAPVCCLLCLKYQVVSWVCSHSVSLMPQKLICLSGPQPFGAYYFHLLLWGLLRIRVCKIESVTRFSRIFRRSASPRPWYCVVVFFFISRELNKLLETFDHDMSQ
jgi:hypothetical protein